jgi:hypothetical protein
VPWSLDNAEELNAEHPRSFFIPPRDLRDGLKPGDTVKLIFRLERDDGEVAVERMWVDVVETGPYVGRLVNHPQLEGVIGHGEDVTFGPEHVAAYAYPNEDLGFPTGEPCFVSPSVVDRDVAPEFLYFDAKGAWIAAVKRERPEHRWTLGYLTDKFPETEPVLREAYAGDRPPFETWWRREGDGYVRWEP